MLLDDRVTIATPEGVSLELVLAGVGSRFVARLLDTLIQLAIIIALALGIYRHIGAGRRARGRTRADLPRACSRYDVPFEVLNGGRTVGKLAAGIRVVGDHGEPVGFLASAIRNILRIVDFLPVFYVVGVDRDGRDASATNASATSRRERSSCATASPG